MLREYQLLIPILLNDHQPVPAAIRLWIEQRLCECFGGFTRQSGLEGAWVAPDGTIMRDWLDGYLIAAADSSLVFEAATEIGDALAQQAMYLRLPDMSAVIVPVGCHVGDSHAALVTDRGSSGSQVVSP